MRRALLALSFLGFLSTAHAQIGGGGGSVPFGTSLPATCTPGPQNLFFLITNTPTGSLYQCSSLNTWTTFSGSGTVTSVTTSCGLSGGPITGTGTLQTFFTVNMQTGTTYTVQDSDCSKMISQNNASPVAFTLPQAGASGQFNDGWWAELQNRGAGSITLTPTVSTIDGAASLVIPSGQGIVLRSNGSNFFTERGLGGITAVVNDTNVTGSLAGNTLTLAWAGTLAAGRLNSNVVQAFTNDTNITASISAQNATIAWSGILAAARGGTANAFFQVSGPATSAKTYTFPNASSTVLTDNALVTAAQGGTANAFFQVSGPASSTKTYTFPNASSTVLTDNALVTGAQGGTNNGFMQFTGPASSTKTYTLPNSSTTIVTIADTGSVTNAMLAGSIATTKLLTRQGSGSSVLTGGTFAGGTGAALCEDAGGAATDQGCTPPSPAGATGSYQYNNSGTQAGGNLKQNTNGAAENSKAYSDAACNSPTYNSGGTTTLDLSLSNCFVVAMSGGNTTLAVSNASAGSPFFKITTVQDTSPRTYTFPASFDQACQPTTTSGGKTWQTFTLNTSDSKYRADGCYDDDPAHIRGPETSTFTTPGTGEFNCVADSTDHSGLECKANNSASIFKLVLSGVDINPVTGQVTGTHLGSALGVSQGGIGVGTLTGLALGNGTSPFTPATATDVSGPNFCQDAGANDTYACNLSPAIASYVTGTHYWFKANTANTGAASINFNAKGALTIKKPFGGSITSDLADNDIRVGQWVECIYDGTNCQMVSQLGNSPAGSGTVTTSGSPANGNLAKFSGATAVTNGNLSGDCSTTDTLAVTCTQINGANLTVNSSGVPTKIAGVTTAGTGTDVIVAAPAAVTGQSTSQGAVTVATSPAAGFYRLNYYANQNAVCTTGSNSVSFTFNWTDAGNARAVTTGNLPLGTAQSTTTGLLSGLVPIHVSSGNVTYTSTVNGTCASGTSTYDIDVSLERMR